MRFARWTFLIAGVYGVLVLIPGFFLEGAVAPPPINHPEFYYGFYAAALVWQAVFLLISRDPARWRPLMLLAVFEKLAFFGPCLVLFALGRLAPGGPLLGGLIDGVWMVLFAICYLRTRPS
jgi:hypothetical protein